MKITVLLCSHRRNKNTRQMADFFLEGLKEGNDIEFVDLLDKKIEICLACDYCRRNYGHCILKDDMEGVIDIFKKSDLIVLATPLYFNSVTSRFKIFIDRTQILYNAKYNFKDPIFKEKKSVVILSNGGAPKYLGQFDGIMVELKHFLGNINADVLEYLKYNKTDEVMIRDNKAAASELKKAGIKVREALSQQKDAGGHDDHS